jgi:hypothetical protein
MKLFGIEVELITSIRFDGEWVAIEAGTLAYSKSGNMIQVKFTRIGYPGTVYLSVHDIKAVVVA